MQNGKKISKKKTTVKRGEKHPNFNEAMIFSVPATALPVCLYITSDIKIVLQIKTAIESVRKPSICPYLIFTMLLTNQVVNRKSQKY